VAAGHGVAQSEAAALLQQCSVPVEEAMMPPGKGFPPVVLRKATKKKTRNQGGITVEWDIYISILCIYNVYTMYI